MHKLSKPQCGIISIQRGQNVQDEGAKEPEGEQAKGRISQAQGANEPGGEPAKGQKSQTPMDTHIKGVTLVMYLSQLVQVCKLGRSHVTRDVL